MEAPSWIWFVVASVATWFSKDFFKWFQSAVWPWLVETWRRRWAKEDEANDYTNCQKQIDQLTAKLEGLQSDILRARNEAREANQARLIAEAKMKELHSELAIVQATHTSLLTALEHLVSSDEIDDKAVRAMIPILKSSS